MKKILALVLAMLLVLGMTAALAADPSTPSITINASSTAADGGKVDTTAYTWYRILEADITTDPTNNGAAQSDGKVAYYTDSAAKKAEIEETNLFKVADTAVEGKYYVELKDGVTAAQIEAAFKADSFDKTLFPTGTFAQTEVAGTATSGTVAPGYYYIESTAGTNAVLQTLTAVTITEKNTYPPVNKVILPADISSEIGKEVHYTLTVEVPETANDFIILTDKMDKGLDFYEITSITNNDGDTVTGTVAPADPTAAKVHANEDNTFTITFSKDTVIANQGKAISVAYVAKVNADAEVKTDIPNTVDLKYGNHYQSKPITVNTKTYPFDFDKVDGNDPTQKLVDAEFELRRSNADDAAAIQLVEITAGVKYRIATADDTENLVTKMVTNGNTITVDGLDLDETYYLVETKAPVSYNGLATPIKLTAGDSKFVHEDVLNYKGNTLPSTGGMGTTILYIAGSILVLGAVIFLVTKRRMKAED